MDNQNPIPNPTPATENIPVQNPPVQETPPSQVYTAPQLPPSPKKPFLTSKIILIAVILLILLGAGGTYLALNSKPKPVPISTTPTPLPTEASAKAGDPTASWKTFINSFGKYSIKLPKEWRVYSVESGELTTKCFEDKIPAEGTIKLSNTQLSEDCTPVNASKTQSLSIENYNKTFDKLNTSYYKSGIETTFQDQPAIKEIYPKQSGVLQDTTITLNNSNRGYVIHYSSDDKGNYDNINQILSTFRFSQ